MEQGFEIPVLVQPDDGVRDGAPRGEVIVCRAGGTGFRRGGGGEVEEVPPGGGVAPAAIRGVVDGREVGFQTGAAGGAEGRVGDGGGEVGLWWEGGRWGSGGGGGGEEGLVEGEEVGVAFGEGEGAEGEAEGDVVEGVGVGEGGGGGCGDGEFGFRHWGGVLGVGSWIGWGCGGGSFWVVYAVDVILLHG